MREAVSKIMAEMCFNCNKDVETESSVISIQWGSGGESGEIRIWDIVTYVYRIGSISLDEFKIHNINHQNHLIDNLEEESLGMCDLCLSLLSNTYKTLRQFESLTHHASFIQQVQNTFKIKKELCTEVEALDPATNPDQTIVSSLSENVNSDLFDSFNYDDDHRLEETDNYSTEDCKVETVFDLSENESPLVSPWNSNPEIDLSQKPVAEKSQMSSKQLVVKIDRLSEKDLEFYRGKRKKDCFNKVVGRKGRKTKPVNKIRSPVAIKKKYSLRKHKVDQIEQLSIPEAKKKYECDICGKVFLTRKNRRMHKKASKKELEKCYKKCEICEVTILWNSFRDHMKRHGPREALKCDKCGKEYFNKNAYEDHILSHSDNFTPYLCRHCGSTFNDKQTLYNHERKHTERKRFSCEICSKEFFYKTQLKLHLVVHTNERSFVCDECGWSFKSKYRLHTHQKIHKAVSENGEYSSKCQLCGRIFKHSISLREHMKCHEKKYECSFCGKKLSKPAILRKHENLHKTNPDYQPRKYMTWKSDTAIQLNSTQVVSPLTLPSSNSLTKFHRTTGNENKGDVDELTNGVHAAGLASIVPS